MVSRKEDKVDFGKLEKEVVNAVETDQRYWRENDAKLRAVHQNVATYDEFRDIVAASHLKPLDKSDHIGQCFKQTWNVSTLKPDDNATRLQSQNSEIKVSHGKLPSNAHEFLKVWKNVLRTPADRYSFVLRIGSQQLGRIFCSEISFGLLGEMIGVLNGEYSDADGRELVAILEALSSVNRFSLSLQFLDKTEHAACSQLLQQLHQTFVEHVDDETDTLPQFADRVVSLMSVYSV